MYSRSECSEIYPLSWPVSRLGVIKTSLFLRFAETGLHGLTFGLVVTKSWSWLG